MTHQPGSYRLPKSDANSLYSRRMTRLSQDQGVDTKKPAQLTERNSEWNSSGARRFICCMCTSSSNSSTSKTRHADRPAQKSRNHGFPLTTDAISGPTDGKKLVPERDNSTPVSPPSSSDWQSKDFGDVVLRLKVSPVKLYCFLLNFLAKLENKPILCCYSQSTCSNRPPPCLDLNYLCYLTIIESSHPFWVFVIFVQRRTARWAPLADVLLTRLRVAVLRMNIRGERGVDLQCLIILVKR